MDIDYIIGDDFGGIAKALEDAMIDNTNEQSRDKERPQEANITANH